jgi:uncharacterized membrane protein
MLHGVRVKRLAAWLVIAMFGLLAALPPVTIAQGLVITTAYPAVTVDPGGSATFPLMITTDAPERVDLAVTTVPEGWTARLRGGGSAISAVFTGGAEPPEAALQVEVPADVAPGAQQVILEASTATQTSQLTLDMTVEEVAPGSVALTTDFPDLRGEAGDFRFDLELANDTLQDITFTIETDAPAGWRVQARPTGEEQAATTTVDAGGTTQIQVTATPPFGVEAGQYPIMVSALGGPQPASAELSVEVTGESSLSLATADERLNARVTVGSSTTIALVVTNDGSAPLTDVSLAGTPPRDWTIEFSPETIPQIAADESFPVEATLRAADNAIAGDYQVTVRATSEDANDDIELRTTVEASPIGGFIGLGLLALVAVGLLFVFRRYGRR